MQVREWTWVQLGNARHASGGVDSSNWAGDKNRKEKKRMGYYLGLWFGPTNGGEKWAKLGWNWA